MQNGQHSPHPLGEVLSQVARVAGVLASRGWTPGASGNLSVLLPLDLLAEARRILPAAKASPEASGGPIQRTFLIASRTGSRMRQIAFSPPPGLTLGLPHAQGGFEWPQTASPTREIGSHEALLAAHSASGARAVLHAHLPGVLWLTHLLWPGPLSEAATTRRRPAAPPPETFLEMALNVAPDSEALMEAGIGFTDPLPAGSSELVEATAQAATSARVIVWPHHGAIVCARDLEECLDLLEVLDAASSVAARVLSASPRAGD